MESLNYPDGNPMLSILSILTHAKNSIENDDDRFIVTGDESVFDKKTGVTLHIYDTWFKASYNDEDVIVKDDFTEKEKSIAWEIKKIITPDAKLKEKEENYKPMQKARRERFSYLHENPAPADNGPVQEEDGAQEYTG